MGSIASSTTRSTRQFRMATVVCVCLAGAGLGAQSRSAQKEAPAPFGPKRTVSVAAFDVKIGISNPTSYTFGGGLNNNSASNSVTVGTIAVPNPVEFGTGLSEVMITALTESDGFTVIEMPAPAATGITQPATGDSPQFLMRAVVSEISCRQRTGGISIGDLGAGQGQYENKVTLDVRLVDPVTNVVLESVKATGKKTSKGSMFGLTHYVGGSTWYPGTKVLDLSYSDFESSPLAEAARLAIQDSVKKLRDKVAKRPWEAVVLKIAQEDAGPELYLNLPGDCGLKVGDKLELCHYGEDILDPKTNLVVGRTRPKPLGMVEVFMTDADRVICKPVGDFKDKMPSAEPGLFVRLPRP